MSHAPSSDLDPARGYPIALAASVILSTTAILIRFLTADQQMPALVLAFWREALVVVTLLLVLIVLKPALLRVEGKHGRYLFAFGVVLALFNSLWTLSVALNGAAVSTVLAYSSVAFTALLGRWLLDEPLSWAKWLAVTIAIVGCALVAEAFDPAVWRSNLIGIVTGMLSGLSYAAYSLMGRSASQRGLNPWSALLYTFAFAATLLLIVNLLPGDALPGSADAPIDLLWREGSPLGWGLLVLLAAGPTLGGYGLYNLSLARLPSSVANLILTTEPVFSALMAYALLGERLTSGQIVGSVLVLGGVVVLRVGERGGSG